MPPTSCRRIGSGVTKSLPPKSTTNWRHGATRQMQQESPDTGSVLAAFVGFAPLDIRGDALDNHLSGYGTSASGGALENVQTAGVLVWRSSCRFCSALPPSRRPAGTTTGISGEPLLGLGLGRDAARVPAARAGYGWVLSSAPNAHGGHQAWGSSALPQVMVSPRGTLGGIRCPRGLRKCRFQVRPRRRPTTIRTRCSRPKR